jgi:uncharacterized membrane-anchored protein YitT (DUF2179 family)
VQVTKTSNKIKEILGTILGAAIMAIGVSLFLLPNKLSTGGFSGLATIAYYIFNVPMGIATIGLNIPLFILALYKLGIKFVSKTIIGTVSLSIFIDIFDKFKPITTDRFLASIYGGIIVGIGTSLILKVGASTGGTDLISNITKSYKPTIKMGNVITLIDAGIVAINTLVFKEIEIGLYSAIAIFLMGKILDIIFEGIDFTKLLIIISDKNQEISEKIQNLERGVTGLYGKGMYSENNKLILICASPRRDVGKIRTIAKDIDKNCFIIITNAREVYGEGFK